MKEMMTFSFRLESDYLTTVRLATGGLCSLAGLNLDDSEDCKVCVTESLLLLMRSGYTRASIAFLEEDGLSVNIKGIEKTSLAKPSDEDEIAFALLGALVNGLAMEKNEKGVHAIAFRFGR